MRLDTRLMGLLGSVRVALALTVGLGLLAGCTLVGQACSLSRAINQVFLEGGTLASVSSLLVAFLILSLGRALLTWGSAVAADRVAVRVKSDLRQRLVAHLLTLGPAYAWDERSGELANTAVEGVEALDAYFRHYLPQLALAALVPLTILLFVFPLDWISGLVLLLTAPLIPLFMILIGNTAEVMTKRQWTSLSRMSAHFLDLLQGLTTLKILGRSREQAAVIARISDRYRQTTMGVLRVAFLSALVLEMVATLSTAVVAVQVGLRLLYGQLGFEQALFALILAPEFYLPLRLLGTRFHAGMQGVTAAERIFEVLATTHSVTLSASPPPSPPYSIQFSDVRHAYESGDRSSLRGISFEIAAGERVALVGPSGAGKSTVAALLLRFQEPDGGTITVGGLASSVATDPQVASNGVGSYGEANAQRDMEAGPARTTRGEALLCDILPSDWRKRVAWVPQHPRLFYGTVSENIGLARPEASRAEVMEAAFRARAHAFVAGLPEGYETQIGERGVRLSGGEAQRIALARAFLKDAPLVILDEATANLDPESDDQVQAALVALLRGRTALIIAHRLPTALRADRILVMDEGRVVAQGRHEDLMGRCDLYRRLVRAYFAEDRGGGEREEPLAGRERASALSMGGTIGEVHRQGGECEPPFPRSGLRGRPTRRLLALGWPYAGRMALAVLLGVATIGSGLGLMATSASIIARAALRPSIAELHVAIAGVRLFGIARGLFRYLERVVAHDVTFRLLARLRVQFYQALEPLAPARLTQFRSGDLLARIVADVGTLENFFLRVVAPPLVAMLVSSLAAALVGTFAFRLAALLLMFLLLAGLGLPLLLRELGRAPGRRLIDLRAELNATLVEGIQGAADLLAFGQERCHLERVGKVSSELNAVQARMARIGGLEAALGGLLMNLATLAVVACAIPLVRGGQLGGMYLALLALIVISSFEAVLPLSQAFQYLEACLAAGQRLLEAVDATPAVTGPPSPEAIPGELSLQVQDLGFSYPEASIPLSSGPTGLPRTLADIDFHLPAGGTMALVGPSGAGKSTILSLLLRFWEYEEGAIQVGGRDLRRLDPEAWRRRTAVVPQHIHLFNATVRDNLLLARPEATEPEIVRAAQQAGIHDFIASLPHGYDTWIGEQGQRLSGGERQRLAIARAILQAAPIWLLDEPTANLDALSERAVLESIYSLTAENAYTVLMATHRLAGLEQMNRILVLDGGRVVEQGRHDELLRRGGLYRRMWDLQRQALGSART